MLFDKFRVLPSLFIVLLLVGTACYSDKPVEAVAQRFQAGYQDAFALSAGPLQLFASLPARLDSIGTYRELLVSLDTHYLSPAGKEKRLELDARLREEWAQWEPYRSDPSRYNMGGLLKKSLVASAGKPSVERLAELVAIMEQADVYYTAARQNLLVDDASLYRLASQKQYLGLEFLRSELPDSLAAFAVSTEEKADFSRVVRRTELALKDYMGFCESVYLNYRDSTYYNVRFDQNRSAQ